MRVADICAGIGAFGRAWDSVGGYCVYACEKDEWARSVYGANWTSPLDRFDRDLLDVDPASVPAHDVLVSGFPCAPFSLASAHRKGAEDERYLWPHIVRIIEAQNPAIVLLENVPSLKTCYEGRIYQNIINNMADLGYYASSDIIDAAAWVPQRRKRLFILGLRDYWGELAGFPLRMEIGTPRLLEHVLVPDGLVPTSYDLSRKAAAYVEKRSRDIREFTQIVGPRDFPTHARTLTASYYRSRSLGTYVRRPNGRIRFLMEQECAELMGLPGDFWLPSDKETYSLLGNAVVYPLALALAESLSALFHKIPPCKGIQTIPAV